MKKLDIVDFHHLSRSDTALAGVKGAHLGEMLQAKLPVPPGFVVTARAYDQFISATGLASQIKKRLRGLGAGDIKAVQAVAKEIQKLILAAVVPKSLKAEIEEAYRRLAEKNQGKLAVAVRGSLAAAHVTGESFAGQQATFLNVTGHAAVLSAIQHVWASFYDAQALHYRLSHGLDEADFRVAVPVQAMVESVVAGILFTSNPLSGNSDEVVIEAAFGAGEVVALGMVTPDRYVVSKADQKIHETKVRSQSWQLVRSGTGKSTTTSHKSVPKEHQRQQKLSNDLILKLAALGGQIEHHYSHPQVVEWVLDGQNQFWLVDTAPSAQVTAQTDQAAPSDGTSGAQILVRGLGASSGMRTGPVRVIHKASQIDEIQPGEVLVTEMTTPAFVPAFQRAAAIVTDTGGVTSHAVVVSREMGIPCVVGSGIATSHLKNGLVVTVDGQTGIVYKGKVEASTQKSEVSSQNSEVLVTGTKVYVNLAEPAKAAEAAALPVDGIGLLRAEFMMAGIGVHPRYMVAEKKEHQFVKKLADGIRTMATAFTPRPVIYRASDFKTNEYRQLTGGAKVEPQEENPMLGYRGALRYTREPDLFALELQALKTVRESYGLRNVWLMIPFVRTVEEFQAVRKLVEATGMLADRDFKLWMMAEVPSNVILLEDFLAAGVDGISIGSNDLTQLILGVDRDNARLAAAFDERNEAVLRALAYVIKTCRRHHIPVSLCGQAASRYPEVLEFVIHQGITSVSVTPDVADATRRLVASIERKTLLDALTRTAHGDPHPVWK